MSASSLFRLENICKEFLLGTVTVRALQGVSMELKRGEFIALQGPSGSGKSTLLNVLGLIESPTSGELFFCGKNVAQSPESAKTLLRKKSIGFIFQNFNLLPILTAIENVEYPLYLERKFSPVQIRKRAKQMLLAVGLEECAKHKPAQLSGGQRQRVAIARALVKEPELILADEPTANLDSKTSEQIVALLMDLKQKMETSVFLATHDSTLARLAEQVLYLKDGRLEVKRNSPEKARVA